MYKSIVLLTKSKKMNGYCVTGVDMDDGKWVRLMQPGKASVDPRLFRYSDGMEPDLLDVITVNILEPCPTEMHPEDVLFDPAQISRCDGSCFNSVQNRLRFDYNEHSHVYFNNYPKLLGDKLPRMAKEKPYSLMIIDPEEIRFRRVNEDRVYADFIWKGINYREFRITDSFFKKSLPDVQPSEPFCLDRHVYLVISLGEEFINPGSGNIEYYKLISAVIDKKKVDTDFGPGLGQPPVETQNPDFEKEVYQRTKTILENLALGVNPYTGEALEDESVFQYPDTIRSLFTAVRLIDEKIKSKGTKKRHGWKKQFSLMPEEAMHVIYSESPLPISRLVERINEAADTSEKKKLSYKQVVKWLIDHGLLEEIVIGNNKVKQPTDKGNKVGITIEKRMSTTAGEYYVTLYSIDAQRFIVENVNQIVEDADIH